MIIVKKSFWSEETNASLLINGSTQNSSGRVKVGMGGCIGHQDTFFANQGTGVGHGIAASLKWPGNLYR
ncbi:MAG: hypothetical protein KJ990_12005 [Proteobacteria bacterium]|jgi:hypothetical protein|nr:hypothetical protein [Pseudomonadota bacterium]MBU1649854.1 hypothetical protein [Pseudomonadota bacterium]